jgi:hypothetical protein
MTTFSGEGAIFDEIFIENLTTVRHPAFFFACAFRHVKLRGKCGRFLFRRHLVEDDEARNAAFIKANAEFYRQIDWALDVTELQSSCFALEGSVPVRLIRRNPDVQFIMSREVALGEEWRNYEPFDAFQLGVYRFRESMEPAELFVACSRSKHFKRDLVYFQRLRAAGLVT